MENNDRFLDEFGTGRVDDKEELDENESSNPSSKPSDFQVLFGGNNNDHFMIGIKLTRYSKNIFLNYSKCPLVCHQNLHCLSVLILVQIVVIIFWT